MMLGSIFMYLFVFLNVFFLCPTVQITTKQSITSLNSGLSGRKCSTSCTPSVRRYQIKCLVQSTVFIYSKIFSFLKHWAADHHYPVSIIDQKSCLRTDLGQLLYIYREDLKKVPIVQSFNKMSTLRSNPIPLWYNYKTKLSCLEKTVYMALRDVLGEAVKLRFMSAQLF